MKQVLRSEELVQFLFGIFLFAQLPFSWWWFPVLILLPDIGMLGYLGGNKLGAFTYNLFHHKGLALLIYMVATYLSLPLGQLIGVILFAHSAMDRAVGYGLKYNKGFKYTHLGEIGKHG